MVNSGAGTGNDGGTIDVESVRTFERLLATEETVMIDFHADWCGPCQMMADTVEELAGEVDTAILKINVEELPQIAARYEVQSIPSFVVIDGGEPTARLVGMQEKADLLSAIK